MQKHWGMYGFENPVLAYIHGHTKRDGTMKTDFSPLVKRLREEAGLCFHTAHESEGTSVASAIEDEARLWGAAADALEVQAARIAELERDLEIARGARSCEECQPTQEYQDVVERLARKK
jgi:hypothetical protein